MTAPTESSASHPAAGWTRVCRLEDIEVEGGVTALVDGRAVAVFRTHEDEVLAMDNFDPFSHASVLSRGIVGTRSVAGESVPFVASPIFKQGFALRTGACLDDDTVRVQTYAVRLEPGDESGGPTILVGSPHQQGTDD
ncbi:hypothetical protein GCM10011519_29100 [Marmoricola endophyticus]|uniref:Rieske-like [2Fe-2S] domain-containing protein n=1 Tax=Marmoricola endophyticus TaxID=2040280 RepID=A0A917BP12_9ACTN|nr:nitrite reductase small subunit NirD [Marmoricola endophyticus]GGF53362.1 hypothetical protein GCM10011519_29100 [Marmoricola endophyticus]